MEHKRREFSFKELYDEAKKIYKAVVQHEIQMWNYCLDGRNLPKRLNANFRINSGM